jgi:protein TonB
MVLCTIDATGKVTEAEVQSSSRPEFEEPALEAVKQWTFKPATQDGIAVTSRATVPIRFEFED